MRYTVSTLAVFRGVGLHSGATVTLRVVPARAGSGIRFLRTDVTPGEGLIPARYDLVTDTRLCTRLTNEHGVSVGTVEHVMAALAGTGITDATLTLDGPEVPVMDGSARAFVAGFERVGLAANGPAPTAIRIDRAVTVEHEGKRASLEPAARFGVAFEIDFADPAIGRQSVEVEMGGDAFRRELADCRTFGHLAEVEQLRAMGLARGGGLENAIVVDRGRVLNPGGLRRADEFVRHKALDAVGDLALAGAPIIGLYRGYKAGHDLTNRLLRALFADPTSWSRAPLPAGAMRLGPMPSRRPVHAAERVAV
ncbi:MAG: UDP-3-O-acyl-N-acetylglucosamine deacetylase [Pseudomonadota bacterium]